MSKLYPSVDPEGLTEFSVVFNDRSLNHMSATFQGIMKDISKTLKTVYNGSEVALVPGGGTVGMEAIARQFATGKRALVIRNGWFSYRWTQIFEAGKIPAEHRALLAKTLFDEAESPFYPPSLESVLSEIQNFKPDIVFAAHVETAAGMLLPDPYLKAVADAVHKHGGLFVLDCIASGSLWVDMKEIGVDILLSAPQKSWSASPSAALIVMSDRAASKLTQTQSTSFALDLQKWRQIMKAYEDGAHAYHATMPTDALARFRAAMKEMEEVGWASLKEKQIELGSRARKLLKEKGFRSVAGEGYESPTVVVCYTADESIQKGQAFLKTGVQTAAGVPLACQERADYRSFRIGLFGLDKLMNIEQTLAELKHSLDQIHGQSSGRTVPGGS